jgi:DNA-binding protein H-NS
MANNYSSWTVDKLKKEIIRIQGVIKSKESRDKKAALAKLVSVARKSGFELHELVGEKASVAPQKSNGKATTRRGKVPPKYRNPKKASETWTGRGRQPLWVRHWVEGGGSLQDLAIAEQ